MPASRSTRNRLLTLLGACCALLLLPAICTPQDEKFKVIEVPLSVRVKEVPHQKLLDTKVYQILVAKQLVVLVGDRSAWVVRGAGNPIPLSRFAPLPKGFNWYGVGCAAGDRIVIGVGNIPTKRSRKSKTNPRATMWAGRTRWACS